jgi:hypothetical protein
MKSGKPSSLFALADTLSIPFNFFPACLQRWKVTLKALISEEVPLICISIATTQEIKNTVSAPVPDYSSHGFAPGTVL